MNIIVEPKRAGNTAIPISLARFEDLEDNINLLQIQMDLILKHFDKEPNLNELGKIIKEYHNRINVTGNPDQLKYKNGRTRILQNYTRNLIRLKDMFKPYNNIENKEFKQTYGKRIEKLFKDLDELVSDLDHKRTSILLILGDETNVSKASKTNKRKGGK